MVAILRSIGGVFVGVLAGCLVVFLIELPGFVLHPLPPGVDPSNNEALRAHVARAPLAAMVLVGVAWTIGPAAAALVAGLIARRALVVYGLIVGAIFVAFDLMNILAFPHPAWLIVVGVAGPLAGGWLGALLAQRLISKTPIEPQPYDMRQKNMAC